MRKYNKNTNELEAAVCNCCGKSMKIQNGMLLEGICSVDTTWGYFSGKDLEKHEFDLCEECYDRITFVVCGSTGNFGGHGGLEFRAVRHRSGRKGKVQCKEVLRFSRRWMD